MRQLTETLIQAQQRDSRNPCVRVTARNISGGVVQLDWERLYAGAEDDYYHGMTLPGDGSLVRVRITPPADARKLYRQRVANPSPQSDFSQWVYTGQYNAVVVACCSTGAEVSIFWIKSDRAVYQMTSTDYGVNWGSPQIIDYTPSADIKGITAACKPGGDIALFFADQSTLYEKKRLNGVWQSKGAWDKSTGDLSAVAVVYGGDWDLLVAGKDEAGNYKLWSLVNGDGGESPSGSWSDLKTLASAPADGDFSYQGVFLDKPDAFRCFFIEHFTGSESYNKPFWSHTVPGAGFTDSLWREPVPFDLSSAYSLALAHQGDYCWLSCPSGVWRAGLNEQSLELAADIISLKEELAPAAGKITVELSNAEGQYCAPGQGSLAVLQKGSRLDFSPGYITTHLTEVLHPSAAGDEENIANSTSGAGKHWQDVDDVTPDENASVVYQNTYDSNYHRDLYRLPGWGKADNINSVTISARCRTYNASAMHPNVKIVCKTGGVVYESEEIATTGSFITCSQVWLLNPGTGNPWTAEEIDSLQIGVALRNGAIPPNLMSTYCTQVFAVIDCGGGNEFSAGQGFMLESYEHISAGGKASLMLRAADGWNPVRHWRARHQFRWNKDGNEACVRDMLSLVLARCGLRLEVKSQSAAAAGFYPDFTINPGNSGEAVVERLLSFVPDVLMIEGDTAYLIDPLTEDSPVYSYGGAHTILEGRYKKGAWEYNRVQVEGYQPESGEVIMVDSFAWGEIRKLGDRLRQVEDKNIGTVTAAQQRGGAWLREAEMRSAGGFIRVPVNCGQQLYDVIAITDSRAGLSGEKWRVLGLNLVYSPGNGEYEQRLILGVV